MEQLTVRTMEQHDKADVKSLWDICFHDEKKFTDWFFSERWAPYYGSVVTLDDELVSAMQSYPLHLRIRDKIVPSAIVAGVSTKPEHSGKGYMGKMLRFFMENMRNRGIVCVCHTPAHLQTFFSRGHFPVSDTSYVTLRGVTPQSVVPTIIDMHKSLGKLYACYDSFSQNYSGIVSRTYADMEKKINDYLSSYAKCCAIIDGDKISAYCVYFDDGDDLYGEEFIADSEKSANLLLETLMSIGGLKNIKTKFPPDMTHTIGDVITKPQGVMGVANVGELIKIACPKISHVYIEIFDDSLPSNNGIYSTSGDIVNEKPTIKISAGNFMQVIVGYKTLTELRNSCTIFDERNYELLNLALPKLKCHIIDEY